MHIYLEFILYCDVTRVVTHKQKSFKACLLVKPWQSLPLPLVHHHPYIMSTTSSRYDDSPERPLFGEPQPRDRMLNLIVGVFTSIAVAVTLVSAFIFPPGKINGVNVFFACVTFLICGSHLCLIYWYRQGDLEPKFRKMIIYNAFSIILLCICGNLYIHGIWINKTSWKLVLWSKPPNDVLCACAFLTSGCI